MDTNRRGFLRVTAGAALCLSANRLGATAPEIAPDDNLSALSLAEASARIRSGAITSTQLVRACLARIAAFDPKLHAFITVTASQALAQAARLDAEVKAGRWRGPLHGIPISLKDIIDTAGIRTTGASAVFTDRVPDSDATVVSRLKDAGAVMIGKNNLFEFAMRGTYFDPAVNPWAADHVTGGSSSGSAVAVASSMCCGALGTDTGGSIRIPASYCGVVGLKATYGLVPIRGIIPGSLSLDHCGPLTRTVEDAAIILGAVAGYDKFDIASADHPREDYRAALGQPTRRLRLGLPVSNGFFDHLDPEVAEAVQDAIGLLNGLTAGSKEVRLPRTMDLGSELRVEAWAYHEEIFKKEADKYTLTDRELLKKISSGPNKDAGEYIRDRWALEALRRTVDDSFQEFDFVVLPTQRTLPPALPAEPVGLHGPPSDPTVAKAFTANSAPFNMYGIPAISVPCGFSRGGLPIGLMIAGPHFSEGRLLALARAYEQATEWHKRRPILTPA